MMFGYVTRRVQPVPIVVLVIVSLICARLGFWQLARADESERLVLQFQHRMSAPEVNLTSSLGSSGELRYRRARVEGFYEPEHQVFLDNQKAPDGRLGYRVMTPFHVAGTDRRILIDRGWVPRSHNSVPMVNKPQTGPAIVEGVLDFPFQPPIVLGSAGEPAKSWGNVWPYIDFDLLKDYVGHDVIPYVLEEGAGRAKSLESKKPMHIGYAVQWFAFSMIALAFIAGLTLRKEGDVRSSR